MAPENKKQGPQRARKVEMLPKGVKWVRSDLRERSLELGQGTSGETWAGPDTLGTQREQSSRGGLAPKPSGRQRPARARGRCQSGVLESQHGPARQQGRE